MGSGRLKVVIPHGEINRIARRSLFSPQFTRAEAHRVYMLRFLAEEMSVGVRKNKDAMIPFDRTDFSARVAWQARVTHWMHIAGANALARLKTRSNRYLPARIDARGDHRRCLIGRERRRRLSQ